MEEAQEDDQLSEKIINEEYSSVNRLAPDFADKNQI